MESSVTVQTAGAPRAKYAARLLGAADLEQLIAALTRRGYRVVGPVLQDDAIVYDELASASQLPAGVKDIQAPGKYRLEKRADDAVFGFVVGPHAFKKYFLPPREPLFQLRKKGQSWEDLTPAADAAPLALFGARSCELQAINIQDQVLKAGPHPDPGYTRRRSSAFVVAVTCIEPGASCFCTSMGGGPRPRGDFDLALTELLPRAGSQHAFYVEIGSELGAQVLAECHTEPAALENDRAAQMVALTATAAIERRFNTQGVRDLLQDNLEHPRWDAVAERCLSCASCTLVCPTCFCTRVDDTTDLAGELATRTRSWDSCFSIEFSHMHGGAARTSVKARYRQWLTHKLSSWFDQFGSSGCVGCGRCITWCPAGIDITEEVAAIRATAQGE